MLREDILVKIIHICKIFIKFFKKDLNVFILHNMLILKKDILCGVID